MSILHPGRRGFLAGVSALLAAPALVRSPGVLMPVKPWSPPEAPQYGRFLTAADNGRVLGIGGDDEMIIRVPSGLPDGMSVTFYAAGKGPLKFQPEAGVILMSPGSFETRTRFSRVLVKRLGNDKWVVMGDTA